MKKIKSKNPEIQITTVVVPPSLCPPFVNTNGVYDHQFLTLTNNVHNFSLDLMIN